jgi:ABC-type lipoprotein release transport system permease subunit
VQWLVRSLAALLALLALLAVGHSLVTSVRRRRRELAVLKTLGFDRRQVRSTVAWQASTLACIGLVLGIPAGLFVGAAVWRPVADGLGVTSSPPFPALAVMLVVPAAFAATNLLAFLPARAAARIRPAVALRAE